MYMWMCIPLVYTLFDVQPLCPHVSVSPFTRTSAARNHFSDQRFLIAAVPKGLLLMQWYQPQHTFKHVMVSMG